MKSIPILIIGGLLVSILAAGLLTSACSNKGSESQKLNAASTIISFPVKTEPVTFTGFITSEDDFVDPQIGVDPSKDTRGMILMNAMARSGLGLAIREVDGWKFYYFSGKFATTIYPSFNGTGGQLDAWNIVLNTKQKDHISVTVIGTLNGDGATNPGGDADGIYYPVITVISVSEN